MDTTPREEYHQVARSTRPERQGVSRRSVIEEAKAKVPTIDLADLLCGPGKMRKVGERWVARCPLPDHEDRLSSFTVHLETNSFFCYGCLCGGDVVELARFAWGYEKAEVAMAAAYLLLEFEHLTPERPRSWYATQERQKPVRDGIDAAMILMARRRLYRRCFEPLVLATEDEDARAHDAQLFWELTLPLAEHFVSTMMGPAVTDYRDRLPDDLRERGAFASPYAVILQKHQEQQRATRPGDDQDARQEQDVCTYPNWT
jgi:hypothetical protein